MQLDSFFWILYFEAIFIKGYFNYIEASVVFVFHVSKSGVEKIVLSNAKNRVATLPGNLEFDNLG